MLRSKFYKKVATIFEGQQMTKSAIVIVSIALLAAGGCVGVGKGKGKAPPPVATPIVTKG